MNTSLSHLPAGKQNELLELLNTIKEMMSVEMVILFGSFARGDWVEDRFEEDGILYEYKSDFDILIVLDKEEKALKKDFSKRRRRKIQNGYLSETPYNVIFHGIDYLNAEIEEGSYFFVDILKEGVMLFDSKRFTLSEPKLLSPKQRKNKAKMYFDMWFENAVNFYFLFDQGIQNKMYKESAFLLHQATERFYMTIILVFTDYKPKLHDLEKLDNQVRKIEDKFQSIFPKNTETEKHVFNLLKKAYIDSRYKLNYKITLEELEYLAERVKKLQQLTEKLCLKKINSFDKY